MKVIQRVTLVVTDVYEREVDLSKDNDDDPDDLREDAITDYMQGYLDKVSSKEKFIIEVENI